MKKPKKLILYSGGQHSSNHFLHRAFIDLIGSSKKKKSLTYIPYCTDKCEVFYRRFQRRYQSFGATDFHMLPIDGKIKERELKKAFNCDGIYLAGGNTFYFLKHLRRSGLMPHLKDFVKRGGVLAGLSAGAIVITPNIEMASFPPYDEDENEVGLKNLKALHLVNFEFLPHFVNSRRMNEAMMMYSTLSKYPIFACADGSGIVINGDQKTFYGDVSVFFQGKKTRIDKWA